MSISDEQLEGYRDAGHLTIEGVFDEATMLAAIADATAWGNQILGQLDDEQRKWYLDSGVSTQEVLRKLDNPVYHRPVFRKLAESPKLIAMVEKIIGSPLWVAFSQVFFKAPEGGGPKPVHQDNFYFGPDDEQAMVTVWIALDTATTENGCLYYGNGTHRNPIDEHKAPSGEPFNLQVPPEIAAQHPMTPAPVKQGGISFHHGNIYHQSSSNTSTNWRRAVAFHFANTLTKLTQPALKYDESTFVTIN
jgi:ectoine hydroxylase-related dioxygenase (phytanoyl-CoA dioxygenase family)